MLFLPPPNGRARVGRFPERDELIRAIAGRNCSRNIDESLRRLTNGDVSDHLVRQCVDRYRVVAIFPKRRKFGCHHPKAKCREANPDRNSGDQSRTGPALINLHLVGVGRSTFSQQRIIRCGRTCFSGWDGAAS